LAAFQQLLCLACVHHCALHPGIPPVQVFATLRDDACWQGLEAVTAEAECRGADLPFNGQHPLAALNISSHGETDRPCCQRVSRCNAYIPTAYATSYTASSAMHEFQEDTPGFYINQFRPTFAALSCQNAAV